MFKKFKIKEKKHKKNEMQAPMTDPFGSYTGICSNKVGREEKPVQDADDL